MPVTPHSIFIFVEALVVANMLYTILRASVDLTVRYLREY